MYYFFQLSAQIQKPIIYLMEKYELMLTESEWFPKFLTPSQTHLRTLAKIIELFQQLSGKEEQDTGILICFSEGQWSWRMHFLYIIRTQNQSEQVQIHFFLLLTMWKEENYFSSPYYSFSTLKCRSCCLSYYYIKKGSSC